LKPINNPAPRKVHSLYVLNHINAGKSDTIPATTAPMPTATSNDGRAQHSKVDTEVNRDAMLTKSCFRDFKTLILCRHLSTTFRTSFTLFCTLLAHFTVKFATLFCTGLTQISTNGAYSVGIIGLRCQHLDTGGTKGNAIQTKLMAFFHIGFTHVLVQTDSRSGDTCITIVNTLLNFVVQWFHNCVGLSEFPRQHGSMGGNIFCKPYLTSFFILVLSLL
jgi:hypothetical protein